MAMNPMQKKARTSFLLGMFLTLIVTGLIIGFLFIQLNSLMEEQNSIVYQSVYVVSSEITSGGIVQGYITMQQIDSTYVPSNAITSTNYASYIKEVTTSKINLEIGTILTTDMLNTDGVSDASDTRLQEYNMIVLPTLLTEGDTIDIRLRLPSGEDYIVLSKKYIEQADADTIWIKVSEDEILTMSNAIVEAYIMEGSLLYATTYTDAGSQDSSTPTYIASSSVISLMNTDPNITATARAALAARYTEEARSQRNTINSALNSYSDDALDNVEDGVAEEIEKQQSARQEYIESLGIY